MFKVKPWSLRSRNRIIAALAQAVVVVEAREQSGAFITARHAIALRRKLFAMRPSDPTQPTSLGPERLIAHGAIPVSDPAEVAEWLRRQVLRVQESAQINLEGTTTHLGGMEPADDEDQALHVVMAEIGRLLQEKGVDLKFVTETKLNKWVSEVANRLNLPITRTWYLRGSYVHSPLVTVDTLRRWRQLRSSESTPGNLDIRRTVEQVTDRWNLLYTRGEVFLERFYREEAPEEYRDLYLTNLVVGEALGQLSPLLQPESARRVRGDLTSWARIETRLSPVVLAAFSRFREALSAHDEFDAIAPLVESYTFLLEDVSRWLDRAATIGVPLTESARSVGLRLIQTYSDSVWKLPAAQIAIRKAQGPRSPELRRTMQATSESLAGALQRNLPAVADDWSRSIKPVELKFRSRIRETQSV